MEWIFQLVELGDLVNVVVDQFRENGLVIQ
jgi:hypothetical protein